MIAKNPYIVTTLFVSLALLAGCSVFESTETKQIKACSEDIKSGLNDPSSFEFLSTRAFKADDGTHRIELKFTAKNALGGRVRGEAICGFKTQHDSVLNPDDIFNKDRELARSLRDAGINLN
jgi:hypothetical protein